MLTHLMNMAPAALLATLTAFIFQRSHFLLALLSLEATLLVMALYLVCVTPSEAYMLFVLLTFGACEAALGLACLVSMTRSYGSDMINITHVTQC